MSHFRLCRSRQGAYVSYPRALRFPSWIMVPLLFKPDYAPVKRKQRNAPLIFTLGIIIPRSIQSPQYNLSNSQLSRLLHIQNSVARAVVACVGLNWLLVSFWSHVNKTIIHSFIHSSGTDKRKKWHNQDVGGCKERNSFTNIAHCGQLCWHDHEDCYTTCTTKCHMTRWTVSNVKQEAQLSQTNRATLCIIWQVT